MELLVEDVVECHVGPFSALSVEPLNGTHALLQRHQARCHFQCSLC